MYCELQLWDEETSYASGWADVIADAPNGGDHFTAHVDLVDSGRGWYPFLWDQPHALPGLYISGYDEFGAMEGVRAENVAIAYMSTHDGGEDNGWAYAEALAQCWMWAE